VKESGYWGTWKTADGLPQASMTKGNHGPDCETDPDLRTDPDLLDPDLLIQICFFRTGLWDWSWSVGF